MRLVDIEVELVHATEKAYLVTTGDIPDAVWVPKSQCEFEFSKPNSRIGILTLDQKIAEEKRLV